MPASSACLLFQIPGNQTAIKSSWPKKSAFPQETSAGLRYKNSMRKTVDDQELAAAAAEGDAEAFSALLTRHYDRVFALSFRLTGQRAEAEDLTQDICAALPAKLMRFEPRARFTTWLYRVIVNTAHDRRRRAATHARAADGWGDWEVSRQAEIAEARDQSDWLMRSMAALNHDLRDTLALVLDDLSQAEAAEILGVSPGTVAWRVSEAKKALRALKEQEDAS
jgi:RNA polymerase sigma-70 factor (ECF subfamily)